VNGSTAIDLRVDFAGAATAGVGDEVANEPEATTVDGLDPLRLAGGVAEDAAGVANGRGEGGLGDVHVRPERVEQSFLRHDAVALLDEVVQQLEHARFRFHRFPAAAQLVTIEIELEITESKHSFQGFRTLSPHFLPDFAAQPIHIDVTVYRGR
jgi:hypothetical protein